MLEGKEPRDLEIEPFHVLLRRFVLESSRGLRAARAEPARIAGRNENASSRLSHRGSRGRWRSAKTDKIARRRCGIEGLFRNRFREES